MKKLHLVLFNDDKKSECFVFLWALDEAIKQVHKYAVQNRKIDFAKYGKIILHGQGKPSPEVIEEMQDTYGYKPVVV